MLALAIIIRRGITRGLNAAGCMLAQATVQELFLVLMFLLLLIAMMWTYHSLT